MLALVKCKLLRLPVLLAERSAHQLSPGPESSLGTLAADNSCCCNVTLHPQVLLNQSCHHPAGALLPGELPKRNIASTTQPVGAPSCSCLSLPKTRDYESLETHLLQLLFGSVLPTGYSRGGKLHSSSSLLLRRGMNNGNSSVKHHRGTKHTTQALQAEAAHPAWQRQHSHTHHTVVTAGSQLSHSWRWATGPLLSAAPYKSETLIKSNYLSKDMNMSNHG